MDTSADIVDLSNQLAQAVEAALNPAIPQEKRHEAYNACEEFKEKSPLSIPCSVYLSVHGSHLVRHFGLQLMEYCVKYKWYEIDQPQKISIKEVTMSLLRSSEGDITQHVHLRDALSRVTVEMMKREWPQHWPTLLPELYQIASLGYIQAEIVLLIFLRFVEDIVVLQTLEYAQRRRDLYQHLTLQLEEIFTFLVNLMAQHYRLNVPESVRVINLSLKLLSEIVEFAFVNRIAAEETRLLPVLCNLLSNENYQLETAECLLRIASKKGKQEDKRIICKLLLNSTLISSLSQLNLMLQNGALNERNYLFIKKVSELLSSICTLLCTVVKNENDNPYDYIKVQVLVIFLEILANLCKHASLIVAFNVNTCWSCLFKHKVLSTDTNVLKYIPKWVSLVTPKLVKIPYNPERVIPLFRECYNYLTYDFESVDAFNTFYYRFRVELYGAFRHLTKIAPLIVFACMEQWLDTLIRKTALLPSSSCSPESEEYLEWEAISGILEVVINNLPAVHGISFDRGVRLLDLCFSLKPTDACIASFLLSCISPLMYFVQSVPSEVANVYVPQFLDRVFAYMVFESPREDRLTRSRNTKNLRKHAACLLLKLSCKYPTLFVPFFDSIHKAFNDQKQDPDRLSKLEQVIFLESVIQISNGFCNYESQSRFIKETFAEVNEYWLKITNNVLDDYSKFVSFIGLDTKPSEYGAAYKNRSELLYCVDVISAIIKRSIWPESKEATLNGGFIVNMLGTKNEHPIHRNPATPHILPALPGIFSLIKLMHCSWTDEAKNKLPDGYERVHDMSEHELKSLFGAHIPYKDVDDVYEVSEGRENALKMQSFLINLYELCFAVLAKACNHLGNSFYELPNFVPSFGASVFSNLDAIPDYRFRTMIKTFLRPFVYYCPTDKYDDILVPILSYFSTYVCQRLSNKWAYLKECRENGKYNEDESEEDSKELVEHYLNTQVSREYMDVIRSMMLKISNVDTKQVNGTGNSNDEWSSPSDSQSNLNLATNAYESLSDLGVKLLRCETARYSIVNYILNSISWVDSTNSLKASMKIPTIVKQLFTDGIMTPELSVQILTSLLQGLQVHGQHDANQGSLLNGAVQIYQLLRPMYPQTLELMTMVPGINLNDLQKFDAKVLNATVPHKVDKGLREQFRKLVNNLIGRNIGQLFKRKEAIRDLPKVEIARPKGENLLNMSGNENDIGIANFFK